MPGRPSTFRYLFAGLSPLFALPSAGAAQVNLEFVPYAGVYVPMQKLVDQFIPSSAPFGCNCQFSLEQKRQATLGGRLTVWWTSHLGAEATLGYSGSGVSTVGTQVDDSSAHVVTVSARALMRISPTGGSPWLQLGGGVGHVSRGGGAYSELGTTLPSVCGTGHFAGVVSAGAGFALGRGRLALRLDAEDYLYGARLYVNGESPGCDYPQSQCRGLGDQLCNVIQGTSPVNKFQDDLVLSVGLAVTLGGR
ncbi:MAG: hypothetical protein DMD69_14420 [Gemmatimonadetes bacterium]|nr:MAG: hypothetical protein DMD69_14420 [Gemmatimonadota bacterium]PYP23386.1 MAG: hypothetical protein DMD55_17180 [Gemmatimonadota bacterium]